MKRIWLKVTDCYGLRPEEIRCYRFLKNHYDIEISETPDCIVDGDLSVYLPRRTAPGQSISVINKLSRRSAVGSIRFREGLCFEEDYFFNFEIHRAIRRKVPVPGRFYTYRDNLDSATHALDFRRYFDPTAQRIRLSTDVFLNAGRIPEEIEPEFRREFTRDACRMCIRKDLKT